MQTKAGTSSSASSYGLSSSTIAGTVGVSDSVSEKVSDAIATGAPDSLDVTIGKSIVSSAKPTNFVNPENLFHTSDFKLKPEVQQMITYYDDMYLHANVAYINNIIKDYEYKALSSFTKEKVKTLRNSNSFEEVDDLTYQIICALGSFIPIAGSLFDVLGDTQPVYAADLSSLAIEKMSNPQYMAIITRAITENVNIKHTIYTLIDETTEEVKYVGRTRNPAARKLAHSLSVDKRTLLFEPVEGWTDLSYNEARAAEQIYFEKYGGLDKLKNKISPMSAKKFSKYVDYAIDVMKKLK